MIRRRATLELVRDYRTTEPAELRRQLQQLERGAKSAVETLAQGTLEPLDVLGTEARVNGLRLGPGQALGLVATVTRIQLETPRAEDAGRFAVLYVRGAATVDLIAPVSSEVNAAALYAWAPAAAGALLLFCDGLSYWTVG